MNGLRMGSSHVSCVQSDWRILSSPFEMKNILHVQKSWITQLGWRNQFCKLDPVLLAQPILQDTVVLFIHSTIHLQQQQQQSQTGSYRESICLLPLYNRWPPERRDSWLENGIPHPDEYIRIGQWSASMSYLEITLDVSNVCTSDDQLSEMRSFSKVVKAAGTYIVSPPGFCFFFFVVFKIQIRYSKWCNSRPTVSQHWTATSRYTALALIDKWWHPSESGKFSAWVILYIDEPGESARKNFDIFMSCSRQSPVPWLESSVRGR
jgi:hypothetical protein